MDLQTNIIEEELTHSHNMLQVASELIEYILETGNISKLSSVLSIIVKADDNLVDQLDTIIEANLKKTA